MPKTTKKTTPPKPVNEPKDAKPTPAENAGDATRTMVNQQFGKMKKAELMEVIVSLVKENKVAAELANENHRMNEQLNRDNEKIAHGKALAEKRQSQTIQTTAEFINSMDVQFKMFRKHHARKIIFF